ncbi:MAG: RNA polymerase sigma factor [Gammaproteobacteria bacterium]|nr:RNA polymerase sigma factor [Gammaproteobacteria bacterium]
MKTMWNIFGTSRLLQKQLEQRWRRLYRVAYSWCHDPDLSSDLVQDTLQKAIRKGGQLNNEQALDAWLFAILTNCWRDHCRRQKEMVPFDEQRIVDTVTDAPDDDRMMVVNQVRSAVARLSEEQREVLSLVDLEGMSYSEVAKVLDIPMGTVMSRLCRARRQLKDILEVKDKETNKTIANLRRIK